MKIECKEYDDLPDGYHGQNRQEMFHYIPQSASKILDIGCGEGNFGKIIKGQSSMEVWGIELFSEVAEKAKLILDHVLVGNIETDQFSIPENYFDCIVFNDVLEHLYYPWDVLKRVKLYLKSSGCIIASIPNIRYYAHIENYIFNGNWDYESSGLMDRTHLRFFTRNSILKMFDQCGYSVLSIDGLHEMNCPWKFRIINKLMRKMMGISFDDMKYLKFACVVRKIT